MSKEKILHDLIDELSKLVKILELDPNCICTDSFRDSLDFAMSISKNNHGKEELVDLSYNITSIYGGGSGSFSDYEPSTHDPTTGKYSIIPGTEEFRAVQDKVYDLAFELRVIGSY